jgi:tetratricopeptide (TPR) repeat protein
MTNDQLTMNQEVKALIDRGHQLRQEGKLDAAIQIYARAIQLEPDNCWSYQYLGETLTQKGDLEQATTHYRQALTVDPNFCWAHHCLAQILTWQGQIIDAIASSRQAIEIEPQIADFHEQLGRALVLQGNIKEAIICYQQASELKPEFWQYQFELGNLLSKGQRLEAAIESYNQAIELNPNNYQTYYNLAEIFSQQQNWNEAIVAYKLAINLQPESIEARQRLEEIVNLRNETPVEKTAVAKQSTQLFTDKRYLQDFYSSSPKLLIAQRDRTKFAFLESNPELTCYEYRRDESVIIPLGTEITELVEVQWSPGFFLGFMTATADKQELAPLIDWWQQTPTNTLPPQLAISAELPPDAFGAEFWQLMFVRITQTNREIAQRISTLQQQYLELRTLHEDTQNAFAAVEDYLNQAKLPPLQLAFEHLPEKDAPAIFLQSQTQAKTITQLLPISSRSLAAIELHFEKINAQARGNLKIELKTPENQASLAKWLIPYQQISGGWLPLDLPNIDLSYPKEVVLSISPQTELGPPPSLSAGKIQPIPEARVQAGESKLDRSLALRLWQGLPGTRRFLSPYRVSAVEEELEPISAGYLGARTLSRITEITPNLTTEDFPHIAWREEGEKILTHPREGGKATVAMLPFSFPPQGTKITATVITENAEASEIEYALVLSDGEIDPTTFIKGDFSQSIAYSGWISIEPNLQRQIHLNLEQPVDRHYHIILATRLPAKGHWAYAWAHWLNFFISS